MVLVQEYDSHDEHVIYYLSQSLTTTETKYLHVEKLALEQPFKLSNVFVIISYYMQDHYYFRLQPYETYPHPSIDRGKVLQMDS
jgi:hypothetical protein